MAAKPAAARAATTVEFCGLGTVSLDIDDPAAADRYLQVLSAKVRNRWLATLLDSDDTRARAAGLLLQGKLDTTGPMQPTTEQNRDALVQLAVGASDPAVYAMAVDACDTYTDPAPSGSCQQITLQRWSALDADNALPWLLLASKAHAAKDAATEGAAYDQAAGSRKADDYNFLLYSATESSMPSDVTPLERWYLAIQLTGIESAIGSMQYGSVAKHCSVDAMQDAHARQQCGALAQLLVSKGTTMLDMGLGIDIGARAGWPRAQLDSLLEQRDALTQAFLQAESNGSDDEWGCEAVRRGIAYMSRRARMGELGAARDALEQSGETVSELAQKRRAAVDTMMREAQRRAEQSPPEPPP